MNARPSPGARRAPIAILLVLVAGIAAACSGTTGPAELDPDLALVNRVEGRAPVSAPEGGETESRGIVAAPDAEPNAQDGALIIRTGTLELETQDIAASLPRARALIAGLGGYISASDEIDHGEWVVATITYRIPVDRWQDAIDGLRGLGDRVIREATQAQEVTSQVVDLKARIANLRASETALIGIMDKSGSIEDVLAVQERLHQVRGEIEQLVAQQQALETRAALAALRVTWSSPVVAVAVTAAGWDLGQVIDQAAAQTVAAGQWLVGALVWLIVVGVPVVGIPLLLIGGVLLLVRRRLAGRSLPAPTAGPDSAQGGAVA